MRFEDQDTYTLVVQFEQALNEGRQPYYDVEDLRTYPGVLSGDR
jgi:hypothetical protein